MMRGTEEKTASSPPNINFLWTGTLKPSAIDGPKSIAQAKNNLDQSYHITYYVEEDQIDKVKAEFADFNNVTVKGIKEVIRQYCGSDHEKETRIYALLARCKAENLPNVPKEILAPIIQSQTAGYFFDTSISAKGTINLPNLNKPALSRNIEPKERYFDLEDQNLANMDQFEGIGCDLYAWFSAMNPSGEISAESKRFFSTLSESTISTWENFFQKGLGWEVRLEAESPEWLARLESMMIDYMLGPVSKLYEPYVKEDTRTVLVYNPEKNSLLTYNKSTCKPQDKIPDCGFTTIDARFVRYTDTGAVREFFCGGQPTGITKYLTGTWRKNFQEYMVRYATKLAEESDAKAAPKASENPALVGSAREKLAEESDAKAAPKASENSALVGSARDSMFYHDLTLLELLRQKTCIPETYESRPGKQYLVFTDDQSFEKACKKLRSEKFAEFSKNNESSWDFRVSAGQIRTLEIKGRITVHDKQVQIASPQLQDQSKPEI
jgi:hypothetical protein